MARQSCFKCWHCRRVEGLSSVCVCVAHVTKYDKPEFIEEPSKGDCASFYSRDEVKTDVIHYLQEMNLEEKRNKSGPRRTDPLPEPCEENPFYTESLDEDDGYPNLLF